MKEHFEYTVTAKSGGVRENLFGIFKQLDLVFLIAKRDFKIVYKQTILGPIWLLITPLFTSIMQAFVFGGLAGLSTDGMPMLLFYMSGNIAWEFLSKTTTTASNAFVSNSAILGKVYFPRLIMPMAQCLAIILNSSIQILLLFAFYLYFLVTGVVSLSPWILLIPILILQASVLGLAIGLCISACTVKYRDFIIAVGFFLQLWLYASPVVYPLSIINGLFYKLILLNPVTAIVENFRFCLMGSGSFLGWNWIYSLIVTMSLFLIGATLFVRASRTFIDTI